MDKDYMAEWRKATVATPLPVDKWDEALELHRKWSDPKRGPNVGFHKRFYKKVKSLMGMK